MSRKLLALSFAVLPLCASAFPPQYKDARQQQLQRLNAITPVFEETPREVENGRRAFIAVNAPDVTPFNTDRDYWSCRYGHLYDSMPPRAKWLYGLEARLKHDYPDLHESDINAFLVSKVDDIGLVLAAAARGLAKADSEVTGKCGEPKLPDGWKMKANGEVFFSAP